MIEQGTKFATLSPDWLVNIKGGKRVKKKLTNNGNYKNLSKAQQKRHNQYLMSLEKLLANTEYTGEKENTKKDKKPHVAKYHYFNVLTLKYANAVIICSFLFYQYSLVSINVNRIGSTCDKIK